MKILGYAPMIGARRADERFDAEGTLNLGEVGCPIAEAQDERLTENDADQSPIGLFPPIAVPDHEVQPVAGIVLQLVDNLARSPAAATPTIASGMGPAMITKNWRTSL